MIVDPVKLEECKQLNSKVISRILQAAGSGPTLFPSMIAVEYENPRMIVEFTTETVYMDIKTHGMINYYHANHKEPNFPEEYRQNYLTSICRFTIKPLKDFKKDGGVLHVNI